MKITTKILKKIIQEEITNLLTENTSNLNIHNIVFLEDGESSTIPLVYGQQLMEAYETDAEHVLYEYFSETIDKEKLDKITILVNDSIEELCLGETGFQAQELLKSLDPKFKGIPKGHLIFDDMYGDTFVNVKITPNGLEVVDGQERIDENGRLKVSLGYGSTNMFDSISIIHPKNRLYKRYFGGMDSGSGGRGNQDIRGSIYVDFNKMIQDVNSGQLGIRIEGKSYSEEGQFTGVTYKISAPVT